MSIVINVQGGSGNVMYTGPVQIINNYTAPPKPLLRCYICGRSDEAVRADMFGDVHPACIARSRDEARQLADEIYERNRTPASGQWRVIASTPDGVVFDLPLDPLQIAPPLASAEPVKSEDTWLDENENRHAGLIEQLQANAIEYWRKEQEWIDSWSK